MAATATVADAAAPAPDPASCRQRPRRARRDDVGTGSPGRAGAPGSAGWDPMPRGQILPPEIAAALGLLPAPPTRRVMMLDGVEEFVAPFKLVDQTLEPMQKPTPRVQVGLLPLVGEMLQPRMLFGPAFAPETRYVFRCFPENLRPRRVLHSVLPPHSCAVASTARAHRDHDPRR